MRPRRIILCLPLHHKNVFIEHRAQRLEAMCIWDDHQQSFFASDKGFGMLQSHKELHDTIVAIIQLLSNLSRRVGKIEAGLSNLQSTIGSSSINVIDPGTFDAMASNQVVLSEIHDSMMVHNLFISGCIMTVPRQ